MRLLDDGFLTLGRIRGVAIRAHWSTPLGALLLGGFELRPAAWALFAGLVLVHELAHAAAARAFGVEVTSADLMPYGGRCRFGWPRSEAARAAIAAAGPAAHVVLCTAALGALRAGGAAWPPAVFSLLDTFAAANAFLAALNLLPFRPLDGALAWRLVPLALTAARRRISSLRRVRRRPRQIEFEVISVPWSAADEDPPEPRLRH